MKIAIIGSGIVGAFANHAIQDTFNALNRHDVTVTVLSTEGKPTYPPPGAFYLHEYPGYNPGLFLPDRHVEMLLGTNRTYYAQLQGTDRETSADRMPLERSLGVFRATNALVEYLWAPASTHIQNTVSTAEELQLLAEEYDLVINTANISQVRPGSDGTRMQLRIDELPILVCGLGASREGLSHVFGERAAHINYLMRRSVNGTMYNCSGEGTWLRTTWIDKTTEMTGQISIEMSPFHDIPDLSRYGIRKVAQRKIAGAFVVKNVSCAQNVINVGRWATWNRKELSHEAYYTVQQELLRRLT